MTRIETGVANVVEAAVVAAEETTKLGLVEAGTRVAQGALKQAKAQKALGTMSTVVAGAAETQVQSTLVETGAKVAQAVVKTHNARVTTQKVADVVAGAAQEAAKPLFDRVSNQAFTMIFDAIAHLKANVFNKKVNSVISSARVAQLKAVVFKHNRISAAATIVATATALYATFRGAKALYNKVTAG